MFSGTEYPRILSDSAFKPISRDHNQEYISEFYNFWKCLLLAKKSSKDDLVNRLNDLLVKGLFCTLPNFIVVHKTVICTLQLYSK